MDKITIITVCYNAQESIEDTIKSVIAQSYPNIEYLIIDGNSSDNTVEIIKKYSNRLHYVSEPDKGIFDAMNKGIDMAKGDWVIFMNSGDIFSRNSIISEVFQKVSEKRDISIIYGSYILRKNMKLVPTNPFYNSSKKIKGMGICHQSIFVRTEIARKYHFDLNYKVAADYNMMMNAYRDGFLFFDTNLPVAIYDTNGFSAKNALLQLEEVARICKAKHTFYYYYLKQKISLKNFIKKMIKS